jgi:hypothetical protein
VSSYKSVAFGNSIASEETSLPKLLGRTRELSEPPRPRPKISEALGTDFRPSTSTVGLVSFGGCVDEGAASTFSAASTVIGGPSMLSTAMPSVISKAGLRNGSSHMRAYSAPCKKAFADDDGDESEESTEIPPTTEGWDETTEGGPMEMSRALAVQTHRAVFRQRIVRSRSRSMRQESRDRGSDGFVA